MASTTASTPGASLERTRNPFSISADSGAVPEVRLFSSLRPDPYFDPPELSGKQLHSLSTSLSETLKWPTIPVSPKRTLEVVPQSLPPSRPDTNGEGDAAAGRFLGEYMRGKHDKREYYQVRRPEILLPAEGPGNDATRVINGGKALLRPHHLVHALSEPTLSSAAVAEASPARKGPSPREAPPSARYSEVSRVALQYPEWDPYTLDGRPQRQTPQKAAMVPIKGPSPRRASPTGGGREASQDPRDARRLVKTVSRVVLQYPEWDPYTLEGRPQRRPQYKAPVPRRPLPSVRRPSSRSRSPSPEELTPRSVFKAPVASSPWGRGLVDAGEMHRSVELDEIKNLSSTISPKGKPTRELVKSMVMMDTFYKMRRLELSATPAGSRAPSPSAEGLFGSLDAGASQEMAEGSLTAGMSTDSAPLQALGLEEDSVRNPAKAGETLLRTALKELTDNTAVLREQAATIAATQEAVTSVGGTRHATNVVMLRSYAAILRKIKLLSRVELRVEQVEALATEDGKAETLQKILDLEGHPQELLGLHRFIRAHVHRPGDPVDADRSDFNAFVSTFKLPKAHATLERLRDLTDQAMEYWAQVSYEQAVNGASKEQLESLMALARDLGADKMHPYIRKAKAILMERIAERVLKLAEEAKALDATRVLTATFNKVVPTYGLASKDADKVEQEVFAAAKEGVTAALYEQVQTAVDIIKKLREADGERKRLMAREIRRASEALKAGNIFKKKPAAATAAAVAAADT